MGKSMMRNLTIAGTGSSSGGSFNNVSISGEGKVDGNVECNSFKVMGTFQMRGNLKATTGKLMGTAAFKGNLNSDVFEVAGTADIAGSAVIKELKIQGVFDTEGNLSSDIIKLYGQLKVQGDCNTEGFISKGPFKIGGLLNVGNEELELHSKCEAREIGGEKIHIKRGTDLLLKRIVKFFYMPADFYKGHLTTECIEGDDIYLEYTKAGVVRGNNVKVGPGCEIGLVEYKEEFGNIGDSLVKESRKV